MRKMLALSAVAVMAVALVVVSAIKAEDKEVTLKGTIVCGKCTLKKTDACSNVLIVKEKDKDVEYYITDKDKNESYHACKPNEKKEAEVKGVVTEKDGKKFIKGTVTVK